jgi:hypothetical protein
VLLALGIAVADIPFVAEHEQVLFEFRIGVPVKLGEKAMQQFVTGHVGSGVLWPREVDVHDLRH